MTRGSLRRKDRALGKEEMEGVLNSCLVGRVATVGSDGMPYITPLNFVYDAGTQRICFHHSTEPGHLLENLAHSDRVCFEVDEPGAVFASGDYACNTGQAYRSVVCFGKMVFIEDVREKKDILALLAKKYIDDLTPDRTYKHGWEQLAVTAVLAMDIEMMTGKFCKAPE
jgi:nitroimidazol reductase NimA-like FMN-containing flavoprotein (pyridoxamine 5'-phosphate oxidase superfamily)